MAESMPTYTADQVRGAEKPLLEDGEPLMQRAAAALAKVAADELGPEGGRVLVLAGSGDNGGDALFAGAHLAEIANVTGGRVPHVGSRAHRGAGGGDRGGWAKGGAAGGRESRGRL